MVEKLDMFRLDQKNDRDGRFVPLLERMRKHPEFREAACYLRCYITGLQTREAYLVRDIANLKKRLKRYEK